MKKTILITWMLYAQDPNLYENVLLSDYLPSSWTGLAGVNLHASSKHVVANGVYITLITSYFCTVCMKTKIKEEWLVEEQKPLFYYTQPCTPHSLWHCHLFTFLGCHRCSCINKSLNLFEVKPLWVSSYFKWNLRPRYSLHRAAVDSFQLRELKKM